MYYRNISNALIWANPIQKQRSTHTNKSLFSTLPVSTRIRIVILEWVTTKTGYCRCDRPASMAQGPSWDLRLLSTPSPLPTKQQQHVVVSSGWLPVLVPLKNRCENGDNLWKCMLIERFLDIKWRFLDMVFWVVKLRVGLTVNFIWKLVLMYYREI